MSGSPQNPRPHAGRTSIGPLPGRSGRSLWAGLVLGGIAIVCALLGASVSSHERALQPPLTGMLEGMALLEVERNLSLAAHASIASILMDMYEGGHQEETERRLAALRREMAAGAREMDRTRPTEGWRPIHEQMRGALREALATFDEPRSPGQLLSWIDEFLYNFKQVLPRDNMGPWISLLETAIWAQEIPLVTRDWLVGAMAREWEENGRPPVPPALGDEYTFALAALRQIRESHGSAASRFSFFDDYLLVKEAAQTDTVTSSLVDRIAAHPAILRIDEDTPYLLSLSDERGFASVAEVYRLRDAWSRELGVLAEELRAHAVGRLDAALAASEARDLLARSGAIAALVLGLGFGVRIIRGRMRLDDELRSAIERDALTGLANRYALFAAAPGLLADPERAKFALIHLDLDEFKAINDAHGHHIGDLALIEFSRGLESAVRAGTDLVCRIGGDEFVVLMHGLGDAEREAGSVVERLREALEDPIALGGGPIRIHFSAGIATGEAGVDLDELLVESDLALLEAKEGGRDGERFFRQRLGRRMVHELSAALEAGDVRCVFQPLFDMENGRVVGLEALARWEREDGTPVPAPNLIDTIEWMGVSRDWLRVALGDIGEAWEASRDWLEGRIWLNLGAADLQRLDAAELLGALDGAGVPVERLGVEIADPVRRQDVSAVAARLHELSEAGVSVALDDVGDDRVPLLHLTELPIHLVKLDPCLIRGIDSHRHLRMVVESLASLCSGLDLRILAEGVETAEEEAALRRMGIRYAQGYLYARPVEIEALRDFTDRRDRRQTNDSVA